MAATLGDLLPQWGEKFGNLVNDLRVVVVNRSHDILKIDHQVTVDSRQYWLLLDCLR